MREHEYSPKAHRYLYIHVVYRIPMLAMELPVSLIGHSEIGTIWMSSHI